MTYTLEYLKKLLADYEAQKERNLQAYYDRNVAISRANDVFLLRVSTLELVKQLVEIMEQQSLPHSPE